jgi:hypothetical protein
MKNNEDILKRILLNMKYDPKKTLNENKKTLNESCIPLGSKLTTFEKGKLKSEEYPELGTWGDGTCKCNDNKRCLEFKKSCCKQTIVSVDTSGIKQEKIPDEVKEIKYVTYLNPVDGPLILPENARITEWDFTKNEISNLTLEEFGEKVPWVKKICEGSRKNDLQNCYSEFKNKWLSVRTTENTVHSFYVNNKTYSACLTVRDSNGWKTVENIKFFTGYYTSCNPLGEVYVSPENKPTQKNDSGVYTVVPQTGKEILNKRIEGTNTYINDPGESYDNEEEMLFQMSGGN